jgi:hypothetical protein
MPKFRNLCAARDSSQNGTSKGVQSDKELENLPKKPAVPWRKKVSRAFTSFTQAAGSFEKSYLQLQGEVRALA